MDIIGPDIVDPRGHFSGMTFNKALFDALAIGSPSGTQNLSQPPD